MQNICGSAAPLCGFGHQGFLLQKADHEQLDCFGHLNGKRTEDFFLRRPNLFAICNNTFSKWWESEATESVR
jgi:hypothetical protein